MSKKLPRLLLAACLSYASVGHGQIITTIAGDGTRGYGGDGFLSAYSTFRVPSSLAIDDSGNVFIADQENHCIRKINTYGFMVTYAGVGTHSGVSGDGGPAVKAKLFYPSGIALDKKGNMFIADSKNNRIRKVDKNGIISTVAGVGTPGETVDSVNALTAQLDEPASVAVDSIGQLFIISNNLVCKVDTNGIIRRIAGKYSKAGNGLGMYGGDHGPAKNADMNRPQSIVVNKKGEIFIADSYNNRIRKIDTAGIITTFAGRGLPKFGGDGHRADSADLNRPSSITFDHIGNMIVADMHNNRIRQIDTNGIITTLVGDGRPGSIGDGGDASNALVSAPTAVAVDSSNNIFIAEGNNVRYVYVGPINEEPISFAPNPCKGQANMILASSYEELATIQVFNEFGQRVYSVEVATNRMISVKLDAPGHYFFLGTSTHKSWKGRAIVLE